MGQTEPTPKEPQAAAQPAKKREYLKQTDVPSVTLDEALRIPLALALQYGKQPASPLEVGKALDLLPNTGHFRALAGAAVAYDLTEGGAWAESIALTELGRRIVAPTVEGDDLAAKREALLRPRVVREFLERYDESPVPSVLIGCNVLETMGVPAKRAEDTFNLIVASAETLGLITVVGGKQFVNLRPTQLRAVPDPIEEDEVEVDSSIPPDEPPVTPVASLPAPEPTSRRVFISHGSDRTIVAALKKMLEYGEFEPVISVEQQSTAKPVPAKVFDEMRSCGGGVIHVAKERTIVDEEGKEHRLLNENVLIEIGGAMALWGDNFILLVEEGTKLPSNLQGLYEVRYTGTTLDAEATMRLLEAFKKFKRQ